MKVHVSQDLNGFSAVVHDGETNRHVTDPQPTAEEARKAAAKWLTGAKPKLMGHSHGWGDETPWMRHLRD